MADPHLTVSSPFHDNASPSTSREHHRTQQSTFTQSSLTLTERVARSTHHAMTSSPNLRAHQEVAMKNGHSHSYSHSKTPLTPDQWTYIKQQIHDIAPFIEAFKNHTSNGGSSTYHLPRGSLLHRQLSVDSSHQTQTSTHFSSHSGLPLHSATPYSMKVHPNVPLNANRSHHYNGQPRESPVGASSDDHNSDDNEGSDRLSDDEVLNDINIPIHGHSRSVNQTTSSIAAKLSTTSVTEIAKSHPTRHPITSMMDTTTGSTGGGTIGTTTTPTTDLGPRRQRKSGNLKLHQNMFSVQSGFDPNGYDHVVNALDELQAFLRGIPRGATSSSHHQPHDQVLDGAES